MRVCVLSVCMCVPVYLGVTLCVVALIHAHGEVLLVSCLFVPLNEYA